MILTYNGFMPKDNFSDEAENLYLRKILSTNIRNLRAKYHLTQERLAENAEISLPYLSDIEHCKTWVSDKTLIKLAKALHSEPSQLLEDTNLLSNKNTEKLTEEKIADIIYQEKKEMIKSINKFCDDTIQKILDLE
ncbi:MAG: helix-turn-helix transcriptional regulator [Spirochaetaceae bacterium]|jgi:transcriptional regulator with XRE-family HTH domain|nr:helix-turn-helix transcriptional regulator [Spirochaetaceae bacterium]MBQ1984236.1 helix-turn-helix transcriptional regulator [Spirochaetaceae bacterium]